MSGRAGEAGPLGPWPVAHAPGSISPMDRKDGS
jgi:hypothetical protein